MPSTDLDPAPGVLLVAPPMLGDSNFRRTVVLLCEHGPEGSFGLILNRPLSLHLGDVLDELDGAQDPLSLGGPVQPNTLHMLHRYGDRVPDTISLPNGVGWGGNFETLKVLVEAGETHPDTVRFFLGYAGWGAGQLDHEIEQGGWIVTRATEALIFPEAPSNLWRQTLRQMGDEYAVLANFPDDPQMN